MSGFEVTGLILGGLPLAISALEYYQAGVSFLKYGSAKKDILKIEQDLKYHQVVLHNTIEILLHQSLPESEIKELLEDPTSSKWRDPEIESALKASLGPRRYIVFTETTRELFETISSLQDSLRKITNGTKGYPLLNRGLRSAFNKNRTREAIERIEKQNEILRRLVDLIQASNREKHNIPNISEAFDNGGGIQDIAQILKDIAEDTSRVQQGADDDVRSMYSVESEIGDEGASLSYLPLSLQEVNEPQRNSKEDALLDTGATACAISISVALQLNLNIEKTEETIVKTAAQNEELPVAGQVHLNLRWKDSGEKRFGTRMWVYVVYGLNHSMLLSHDFTQKHPEVWNIAKTVAHLPRQLNVLLFNKLTEKQRKAEESYRARCLERNKAIADAAKQERLAEQDRLLVGSAPASAAGSSAASTSGSASDPTSGSTSGASLGSAPASTNTASNLNRTSATP